MFNQIGQAKEDIIVAGERALASLHGGAKEEGLDVLRYRRFCDNSSKGTSHCGTTYSATDLSGYNVPQPSSVLSCNVLERKR